MNSLLLAAFALSSSLIAQTPAVVRDINATPLPERSSRPLNFTEFGGLSYFDANLTGLGREFAVTDGTPGGTGLFTNLDPMFDTSPVRELRGSSSSMYFMTESTSPSTTTLWKSDGTVAGTVSIGPITTGHLASAVGGSQWFGIFQQGFGPFTPTWFLYSSDGTAAGTGQIAEFEFGAGPEIVTVGSTACFVGSGSLGSGLWKSDGTTAGTQLLLNINSSFFQPNVRELTVLGTTVYFVADDGQGDALWKSDGTNAGTQIVRRVGVESLTAGAGVLFFVGNDGVTGNELWTSDGTMAGTVLLADIDPGPGDGLDASSEIAVGSTVWFTSSAANGRQLWAMGATASLLGTVSSTGLATAGGRLFFVGEDSSSGAEPWSSDGTVAGTIMLADLEPGADSSSPEFFTPLGANVVFSATTTAVGAEPWFSDGTPQGTVLLGDLDANPPGATLNADPTTPTDYYGITLFGADDGLHGEELWRSDGTSVGTSLVSDINPGPAGSNVGPITVVGTKSYFVADDGTHGRELWVTDGTAVGTRLVRDLESGPGNSNPAAVLAFGERLLFSADPRATGRELWITDGTSAGTMQLTNWPGAGDSTPQGFAMFEGRAFFAANAVGAGREMWVTDGTLAGTVLFKDINPGGGDSNFSWPTVYRGELYFWANDGVRGMALWKTDGTTAGTVLVHDTHPGSTQNSGGRMTVANGLLFTSSAGFTPPELFRSDGTSAGTFSILNGAVGNLFEFDDKLFFTGPDFELWSSDGSAAGTVRVKEFVPGVVGGSPLGFTAVGDRAFYFIARDDLHGSELWRSDGTTTGTVLAADIMPGPAPSFLTSLILSHGKLVFPAQDPTFGTEMLQLDVGATAQSVGSSCADPELSLDASEPVFGSTFEVRGDGFTPGSAFVVFLGGQAQPAALIGDCYVYFDAVGMGVLNSGLVAQPNWTQVYPMPNLPILDGVTIVLQAIETRNAAPLGIGVSNGVVLSFGQ